MLFVLSTLFVLNVDALSPLLEDPLLQQDPWAFPPVRKALSEKATTIVFNLETLPKHDI